MGVTTPRSDSFLEIFIFNKLLDSYLEIIVKYTLPDLKEHYKNNAGDDDGRFNLNKGHTQMQVMDNLNRLSELYLGK